MRKKTHTTLYIEPELLKAVQRKCIDTGLTLTGLMAQLLAAWVKGERHQNVRPIPAHSTAVVVPDKLVPAVERFLIFLTQEPRDEFMADIKAMILKRIGIEQETNGGLKEGNGA